MTKFQRVPSALLVLALEGAFRLCSDKEGKKDLDAVKEMENCSEAWGSGFGTAGLLVLSEQPQL